MTQVAGVLEIQILTNLARLQKDMNDAKAIVGGAVRGIEDFANKAKAALGYLGAGLSAAAFGSFIKGAIDAADHMRELSQRTGIAGQDLLVLEGAAMRGGVAAEEMGGIISKATRQLIEAQRGTGEAAAAYQALGIKLKDSQGNLKTFSQLLEEAGKKFKDFQDGPEKALLAIAAFGKGGDRLIPVMENLEETRLRFQRLGIQIDEGFLRSADEFNDKIKDMKALTEDTGRKLAALFLPVLNDIIDAFIEFKKKGDTAATVGIGFKYAFEAISVLGSNVAFVLKAIGLEIGGIAAQIAALVSLDFGRFREISKTMREDAAKNRQEVDEFTKRILEPQPKEFELRAVDAASLRKQRAPGIPDLKGAKAAADAYQALLNTVGKTELDLLKDQAQKRMALLDEDYKDRLIGEKEYWTQKQAIIELSAQQELGSIDSQLQQQLAFVAKQKIGSKEYFEAQKEVVRILGERQKVENALGASTLQNLAGAKRAADEYKDAIAGVNASILELTGNTAQAAGIRFGIQNRSLINQAISNNDPAALQAIEKLQGLTQAQADFNQKKTELSDLNALLAVQEERIQNTYRTGAITELESLQRTGEARRAALDSMQKTVDALKQIALASNNPALLVQAEQAAVALEKLRTETDLVAQKFDTIFTESFSSAFSDFITGVKTAKQAFNDFANSVVKKLADMYAEALAKNIWRAMGMGSTGGGGGIFGGGGLLGLLGLGGSSGSFASGPAGKVDTSFMNVLGGYAMGTDYVPQTGPYLLHQGEKVVPANENSWGGDIIIQNTIDARGSDAGVEQRIEAAMERVKRSIVPIVADAKRRNAFGRVL